MAEFQFIVNGELVTYDSWENIPEEFEHVIKFEKVKNPIFKGGYPLKNASIFHSHFLQYTQHLKLVGL